MYSVDDLKGISSNRRLEVFKCLDDLIAHFCTFGTT